MKIEMKNNIKNDDKLTYGRIESSRKKLAKVLNQLESLNQDIKFACALANWHNEVCFQIEDAGIKLGYALATLTTWDDDCDETDIS